MSEYLRILTQSAEIRLAEKEQEYLLNKNYLVNELSSFVSIGHTNFSKRENPLPQTHYEDSEELLEHYQQIAEETQELVELLKKKNSKLHSDIRALEEKYKQLSNEKEKVEESIQTGNKKLESLQDILVSELKMYEVEMSQLREESSLLNRRNDEELCGGGENLVAVLKKVKISVESANFAVDRLQNELDHKKSKLEGCGNQVEMAKERYDGLLKKKKEFEDVLKEKEKYANRVFDELICSKAMLKALNAANSQKDEVKTKKKLRRLENMLGEKKGKNIKLAERIGELSRTLDRPLQLNRIGSGKKYKKEVDYV